MSSLLLKQHIIPALIYSKRWENRRWWVPAAAHQVPKGGCKARRVLLWFHPHPKGMFPVLAQVNFQKATYPA